MKIEQLYTGCLAEAAYYIESNGEVAIIDPLRETQPYIDMATENGGEIKYIFETHFHADFVSGHCDLARKTGAAIIYGPTAQTNFKSYTSKDNEEFKLGNITIKVLHTPGHTPESSTFLLIDENGNNHSIFTGDTLFIGDVGRPDLAIKGDVTKEDLAGMLYDSLHNKIIPLEDHLTVFPGHGAGSACGKNMSSETYSTLGNQKKSNYALQATSKDEFIKQITEGILPPPQYFPKNAMMNKQGYASFDDVMTQGTKALDFDSFIKEQEKGALVLDTRGKKDFTQGHIPNSMFVGIDGSFAIWIGALVININQPILIIADEGREEEVVMRLSRVGYDNALGFLKGGFDTWKDAGKPITKIESILAGNLEKIKATAEIKILDVRKPGEYEAKHIDKGISFPLDYINSNMDKLDKGQNYYVHCKSGYRSLIAISILNTNGFTNLVDVEGGFDAILQTEPGQPLNE